MPVNFSADRIHPESCRDGGLCKHMNHLEDVNGYISSHESSQVMGLHFEVHG